jgi:flagellar M-ring protein FliF
MPALLQQMTTRGKLVLGASALGIAVVAFMLFRLAAAPSYTTVMTGLDPAETGKITAALDEKGIGYELRNNGTALAVDKAMTAQTQVALAESGLGGGAGKQPGYELLADQKLGASDLQQRATYQRALEGELSNTIGQIQGVNSAQVRLTLPEDELFSDEAKPTTAAVLLGSGATDLEPASVRGIANLVSSSVEGLKPANVTITDGTGRMVWPQGEGAAGGEGLASTSKLAAEAKYANQLESSLNAMLLRTVGPDKAQVKVTADLDVDQVKQKQLKYGRRGTPLESSEETEELEGQGGVAGGAGTRANIPTYQAAGAAGGASNYEKRSAQTKFGVDKTITDSVRAPGAVNRLDVSLVLDRSLAPQRAELERAIAGAAGVQEERGDTLSVSQLTFAEQPGAEKPSGPVPADAIGLAKYVGLGLASLIFLFFVGRHLRRREDEALMGEPMWLRQIEAPTSLSQLEAMRGGGSDAGAGAAGLPDAASSSRQRVEEAVRKEPERVAAHVRTWMAEDLG